MPSPIYLFNYGPPTTRKQQLACSTNHK